MATPNLFETLKNKYPTEKLSLYGDCIIIPIKEFGKDWENLLKLDGYMCHVTDHNGKAILAVQHRKAVFYEKVPFPEKPKESELSRIYDEPPQREASPTSSKPSNWNAPSWTEEEKTRLRERWPQLTGGSNRKRCAQLALEFSGRSAEAIYQKAYDLGAIPKRTKKAKSQTPAEPSKPQEPQPSEVDLTEVDLIKLVTEISNMILAPLKEQLEDLEKTVHDLQDQLRNHEHLPSGEAAVRL